MGSSCAVADVQGDKATIFSATQAVWYQKNTSAMILGLKPENIRVIFRRGSGCYGCNGADTVTYDAAVLSQAVGKPVRVQLTRKDEMAFENYGNAFVIDQQASLDPNGNITTWAHESWSPGMGGRPGTNTPGNVITGSLLGFQPAPFTPRSPAPPPGPFNNNSNGVDELAARRKADPVEVRLRHLRDGRLKEVLQTEAKTAKWETRPSPKQGNPKTGVATGRGAACVLYEGDNGYTALVAEIEVHQDTGKIVVKQMVASSDVGPISNPDGLRNQVEGGALQGLSRALGEEVTWDNEKVTSVDWRTYHSLPVCFKVPKIEAVMINRTEGEVMGAGETSITLVAAAIGNAIFDATGARIRQVPFTAERIKEALATRA
jgi:CO/xanthine dehydrogenase Mo-binding subunit